MALIAVILEYEDLPDRLAQIRDRHRRYLARLADDGTVLASGPLVRHPPGALIVFSAESVERVAQLLDAEEFSAGAPIARRTIVSWRQTLGPWRE